MKRIVAPLALLALLAGCDGAETVNPTPTSSTTAGTTTTSGTGGSGGEGGAPPATVIRTVEQRNPFGNVAASDNRLWDGDFEWSSPFSDQYGWLLGPPYGYAFLPATIGAACRSGIKCVEVPKNKGIVGIGVGADAPLAVSVFAKPVNSQCADVAVFLLDAGSLAKDVSVPTTSEAPDSAGWCLYSTTVPTYPERVFLLVDNNSGDGLLVDDAIVRTMPPGGAPPSPPPPMEPPSAEVAAHREAAREAVLRLRGPYLPPPNAARRAFEERFAR